MIRSVSCCASNQFDNVRISSVVMRKLLLAKLKLPFTYFLGLL